MGYSSGVFPDHGPIPTTDDPHLSLLRWVFLLVCLVLFVIGASSIRPSEDKLLTGQAGPSTKGWLFAAVLAALAILFFVFVVKTYAKPPNPTLRSSEAMIIVPFLIALAAIVLQQIWPALVSRRSLPFNRLAGDQALILVLAVVPFAMLAVVSLFKPIFNARGLILVVPYLLLVLAAGIVRLFRYPVLAVVVLLAIGAVDYSGLRAYSHVSAGRADYKSFAAALVPQIESTDLVFLTPEFFSTPLLYYMTSDWNRIVGRNYEAACRDNPHSRIWALWFYNYEPEPREPIEEALSNYHAVRTVEAPGVQASLYVPNSF